MTVIRHLLSAPLSNKQLAVPHHGFKMCEKGSCRLLIQLCSLDGCRWWRHTHTHTHHAGAAGWCFLGLWDAIRIQLRFRLQNISLAWWALRPPATTSSNDALHKTGSNNSTRIKWRYSTRQRLCDETGIIPPSLKFRRYVCSGLWLRTEKDDQTYPGCLRFVPDVPPRALRCLDAAATAAALPPLLRISGPDRRAAPKEQLDHSG